MSGKGLRNPIFLFYLLVFYVILQFAWWIYLIFSLYDQIYTEAEVLKHKAWMIIGEGSVFLIILLGGIWMIRRAFRREMEMNEYQQNFLMSVTHELKSPIASIKLQLQTLKSRNLEDEKRSELYDLSLKELNRLDSLVANILLTKSIENNNFFLNKKDIKLDDLIKEVVTDLGHGILKDYLIDLELDDVELSADLEAMRSLLINSIENAAKYSEKGSTIRVVLLNTEKDIILNVIDEGQGINDENKGRVFQKFRRIESEMTRKSKGTGLGLFIVKHIVDAHSGIIQLKDNQPKGLNLEIHFKK